MNRKMLDPAEKKFLQTWLFLGLVLPLLSMVPFLYVQARRLIDQPSFLFFPLTIAVGIWLLYRTCDYRPASLRRARVAVFAAWCGMGLAVLGIYMVSPWIVQVASVVATFAWSLGAFGGSKWTRVLAICSMFAIAIPLPSGHDMQITSVLQTISSWACNGVLDAMRVPNIIEGNVLQIEDKKIVVSEVCNGVDSFYALMAIGLAVVVVRRCSLLVSLVTLATIPLCSILSNVIRLLAIAIGFDYFGSDLSTGWGYITTAILLFGLSLACVLLLHVSIVAILDLSIFWRRTRSWRNVSAMLPVILLAVTLGFLVAVGKLSDPFAKAAWYEERANKELALATSQKTDAESAEQGTSRGSSTRLPEFVDMLFRRVLQLNQNNTFARFYVANQMTRYGSLGSARQIMESLAPTQRGGFPKAHAWLAEDLIERRQKGEAIDVETLKHHLKRGTTGEDTSPVLLLAYSQLLHQENKTAESQEFLKRAAKFDPKLLLSAIAIYTHNSQPAQARATADLLVERVRDKKSDKAEDHIVLAAQAYVLTNRIENALEVLQAGMKQLPQSLKLARALSDAFRLKFQASSVRSDNDVQVNLDFLDTAIALDPTNIEIQGDLSTLAQLGIMKSDETIDSLRVQIATKGTSFVARLLLAESSFRRGNVASAINDYEVILAELPRMTLALNNLAMLFTKVVPPRLDESLELIDRAIGISPSVSEFHDSRGDILAALERKSESIASYVLALETSPQRIQTREKLIALYEELSQTEQARLHRDKLAEIQQALEEQRAKMKTGLEQQKQSVDPEKPIEER